MKNKKEKRKRGFTLIELLAVIIILGILMIIAVPAVTKYINDSRKSSYINSAKSIISGTSKIANSESLNMTDEGTTYYIPAKYIDTSNDHKTPYGEFTEAYVGVVTDGKSYQYYWVSNDTSKQGIKNITNNEKLEIDLIEENLLDSDIRETVETTGIEDRKRILILNLDGTWQDERIATKNLNEDGEVEPVDTLLAIFLAGDAFNAKIKNLAGHENSSFNTVDTNILYVKRSKEEPSDEHKQAENIVSSDNSEVPIYAWFDNGTIYWWSEDIKPNLNEDAKVMFTNLQGVKDIELKYIKTNLTTKLLATFSNCINLEAIDLSRFDTSNVISMKSLFYTDAAGESKLTKIYGLEKLNTSKVINMSFMFYGLKNIKELKLGNFDTSRVTDMTYMFVNMEKLEKIDVSNFNTSNVTDISYLFSCLDATMNCKLSEIVGLNKFNTSNVTKARYMFLAQKNLRTVDLSSFDTRNVQDIIGMFMATNLTTIYASPNFVLGNSTLSDYMFAKSGFGYSASNSYILTGGAGTTYSASHTDKEYARLDDPANGRPGYFTLKTN